MIQDCDYSLLKIFRVFNFWGGRGGRGEKGGRGKKKRILEGVYKILAGVRGMSVGVV